MTVRRIALVNHVGEIGGAEISLLNHLRSLDRARFAPQLLAPKGGELERRVQELGVPMAPADLPTSWLVPLGRDKVMPLLTSLGACRRTGADLFHANSLSAGVITGVLRALFRTPTVAHVRDLVERHDRERWLGRVLGLNDCVIAISRAVAARLLEIGVPEAQIEVIHNGVDLSIFDPDTTTGDAVRAELGLAPAHQVVGIIGQIIPWKGHTEFVKAAAAVAWRFPQARFLVVGNATFGSAEFPEELKRMTAETGLADRFLWPGFRRDMPAVMAALDVAVSASWAEPFGRTLIESGAMSRPVVATNVGGAPEIIIDRETGRLVPPKEPAALAEAICWCLEEPDRARLLGQHARRRVQECFDIRSTTRRIQAVYDRLGKGPPYGRTAP